MLSTQTKETHNKRNRTVRVTNTSKEKVILTRSPAKIKIKFFKMFPQNSFGPNMLSKMLLQMDGPLSHIAQESIISYTTLLWSTSCKGNFQIAAPFMVQSNVVYKITCS